MAHRLSFINDPNKRKHKLAQPVTKIVTDTKPVTIIDLVDELGALTEKLAPFKEDLKRVDELKTLLKDRIPISFTGKFFEVEMDRSKMKVLDQDLIRKTMKVAWLEQHSKLVDKCIIKIKRLRPSKKRK